MTKHTPKEFENGDIARAVAAQQNPELKWPCKQCVARFASSDDLIEHERTAHAPNEEAPEAPGIYTIKDETYHGGPGVSRSQLWTLWDQTPYHMRYSEKKTTKAQALGRPLHCAVLEAAHFELRYSKGPDAHGNSKEWKSAVEIAEAGGKECLKPLDFDKCLRIRDAAHRDPIVRNILRGTPAIEQSAYYIDEATGELCKVRPDVFNHEVRVMGDVKGVESVKARDFQSSIGTYGYHLQAFMYPLGFNAATDKQLVDGFVFIAIEKTAPFVVQVFELPPTAMEEARDVYRIALDNYHRCMQAERTEYRANEQLKKQGGKFRDDDKLARHIAKTCWPSYPSGVQSLDLPEWAYRVRPIKGKE